MRFFAGALLSIVPCLHAFFCRGLALHRPPHALAHILAHTRTCTHTRAQLAEAMVRSPWATKWLLKVDDELMGCGHAYFNTLSIRGAAEVLERTLVEEAGAPAPDPRVPLSEMQRVAVYRLNELLRLQLGKKLALAAREVGAVVHAHVLVCARGLATLAG